MLAGSLHKDRSHGLDMAPRWMPEKVSPKCLEEEEIHYVHTANKGL